MESLQHDIARTAIFENERDISPSEYRLDEPLELPDWPDDGDTSVRINPDDGPVVAGIDQAFVDDRALSAVVLLQNGAVVGYTHAISEPELPYIPGLLAFREGGPIVDAVNLLDVDPDLFVFDGSGRIHFREAGLATHLGVIYDCPAIGITKSLLCGTPDESLDARPEGWSTPIRVGPDDDLTAPEGTIVGYAYQSRQYEGNPRINPLYVSPGHFVGAETTRDIVAAMSAGYKLPEPTRLADRLAERLTDDLARA